MMKTSLRALFAVLALFLAIPRSASADIEAIIKAASDIYPAIKVDKSGTQTVLTAIGSSALVYNDMIKDGIASPDGDDPWFNAVELCLDTGNCGEMYKFLDTAYDLGKDNRASGPTAYHVFATIILEEYIYVLKNNIWTGGENGGGGTGGGGGSGGAASKGGMTCMMIGSPGPSSSSGGKKFCLASELGDPNPVALGGGSGGLGGGIFQNPANFFDEDGFCPLSKLGGGGVSNSDDVPGETSGGGAEAPDSKDSEGSGETPGVTREQDDSTGNGSSPSSEENGVSEFYNDAKNNELPTPIDGCKAGTSGVTCGSTTVTVSPSPGTPGSAGNSGLPNNGSEPSWMINTTFRFTPSPNSDDILMSACGGQGGKLGGTMLQCYGDESGGKPKTAGGPGGGDPMPPYAAPMAQGAGGSGDFAADDGGIGGAAPPDNSDYCTQFLKFKGVWDGNPEDNGDDGSSGGGCGPGPKPSAKCCKDNPNYPGCPGGGPAYMKDYVSNPGYDSMNNQGYSNPPSTKMPKN